MDKYQEKLIDGVFWTYCQEVIKYDLLSIAGLKQYKREEVKDNIVIQQDSDITKTKYLLIIKTAKTVSEIYAVKGKKQIKLESKEDDYCRNFAYLIDFENRISKLRIIFVNNLADDLLIKIKYDEADKDAYYAKIEKEKKEAKIQKEKEKREKLVEQVAMSIRTGRDFVNVYFQPCSNKYARAEVELYMVNCLYNNNDDMLIGKYKVPEETFFQVIPGLAYGRYAVILKHFDAKNKLLFESDKKNFYLQSAPEEYDRKHTVII